MTKVPGISEIVFRAPVAAVDEKDDGMRTFSHGKTNIDELIGVLAVRKTEIGIGRFLLQDGFALHAKQYRTAVRWRRGLRRNLAAKHAIDEDKVTDGQEHAKAPPD